MPESPAPGAGADRPPNATTRWLQVGTVILVAALVVTAGLAGYWYGQSRNNVVARSSPPQTQGSVNVHVQGRESDTQVTNLSGVIIDLFSVVPLTLEQSEVGLNLESLPISANPYFIEVGTGVSQADGQVTILLSDEFTTIEIEWKSVAAVPTQNVSLELVATYVAVQGANASVYHYYNTVPFNVLTPDSELNTSFVLDLSVPYVTFKIVPAPTTSDIPSTSVCAGMTSTRWSTLAFSDFTGNLPLASLVNNLSLPMNETALLGVGWALSPTIELGFGGVQSGFPGSAEASSGPSWTGVIPNFIAEGAGGGAVTNSTNHPELVWIWLTGVTYLVTGQEETVAWTGTGGCGSGSLNITFVTSSIALAETGLPVCGGGACLEIFHTSSGIDESGQELEALPDQVLLNSSTVPAGTSLGLSSLTESDSGYAAALAAEGTAVGTPLVYSLNLGEAILLADAARYGCTVICSGNPAETHLPLLQAQLGPAASELASQGIYGFAIELEPVAGGEIQNVFYSLEASGVSGLSSASLFLYGGANQTVLNINGTTYATRIPGLAPVVCETGTSPGDGC
jgi:hypothetical protein